MRVCSQPRGSRCHAEHLLAISRQLKRTDLEIEQVVNLETAAGLSNDPSRVSKSRMQNRGRDLRASVFGIRRDDVGQADVQQCDRPPLAAQAAF